MRHVLIAILLTTACTGDDPIDPPPCPAGFGSCPCQFDGSCNTGFECASNICVRLAGDPGGQGDPQGGDSGTASISDLFPANNEVGTWVEDTTIGEAGVETATDDIGIVSLINGGAAPFLSRDYVAFGIDYYTDGTYELELRIWQFATPAVATEIYTALLTESSTHQSSVWEDNTLGDEGRVANTNVSWWFNVRQGVWLVEPTIGELGVAPNSASKTAGETFIQAVLAKM